MARGPGQSCLADGKTEGRLMRLKGCEGQGST
jgi:hypothetical protein